jgi:hypothetical protein
MYQPRLVAVGEEAIQVPLGDADEPTEAVSFEVAGIDPAPQCHS